MRNGEPTLWRQSRSDGSYLSAGDNRVHAGLGRHREIDGVLVEWPDGVAERFSPLAGDTLTTFRRGMGRQAAAGER